MTNSTPAISIVVPCFNCERFISETLDSILAQTFQDFELILIDDCSTDQTVKIIEQYISKFSDGQIQLIRREKNSGSGSLIRNDGVEYAHGKYILHMDHDDLLMLDALENFYDAAEKFQADLVFTEKYFILEPSGKTTIETQTNNPVKKPVLKKDNFETKVQKFWFDASIIAYHWNKIVRRDFILKNKILFAQMPLSQDMIYSFECFLLAEKYVQIPSIANVYRVHPDSLFHADKDLSKVFHNWIQDVVIGTSELKKFMDRIEYFRDHPEILYEIIDMCILIECKNHFQRGFKNYPPYLFEDAFAEALPKYRDESLTLLIHLIGLINKHFGAILKDL